MGSGCCWTKKAALLMDTAGLVCKTGTASCSTSCSLLACCANTLASHSGSLEAVPVVGFLPPRTTANRHNGIVIQCGMAGEIVGLDVADVDCLLDLCKQHILFERPCKAWFCSIVRQPFSLLTTASYPRLFQLPMSADTTACIERGIH